MSEKSVKVAAGSINELITSIDNVRNIEPDTRKIPTGETWWRRIPLVANLLRFTNFAYKPIKALFNLSDGIQLPPTVGVISPYIALGIGIFDFLYIPFLAIGGYIADPEAEKGIRGFYHWLKSDRCPLNYTHLGRMAMSALSIAAVSVIIATGGALAPIMLTVISSAIFVVAVSTLVKAIIWNRRYTAELKDNQKKQQEILGEMIELKNALETSNIHAINAHIDSKLKYFQALKNKSDEDLLTERKLLTLQKQFLAQQQQFKQTPVNTLPSELLKSLLQPLGDYVQNQQDRLQALKTREAYLKKEIDRTGMFAVGYKAGMATIAAATVAGFALCLVPGLNFIGIPLLAASVALPIAVTIGRAIHLFCTKPEARKDKPLLGLFVAALAGVALFAIPGVNLFAASVAIAIIIPVAIALGVARIFDKARKEKEAAKNNSQSELGNIPPKPGTEATNSSSYNNILNHLNSNNHDVSKLRVAIGKTAAKLKNDPTSEAELNAYLSANPQIKKRLQEYKSEHEQRLNNSTASSDNEPLLPDEDVALVFSAAKLH